MGEQSTPRWGLPYPKETGQVHVGNVDFEELCNRLDAILFPSGDLRFTAKAALDEGWLKCEGQEVSRTTYKALFEAIGTSQGAGNGTTTFNLPDARGRVLAGTGTGPGLTARTNGQKVGEENHVLSVAELASHIHPVNLAGGGAFTSGSLGGSFSGGISGGAADHLHQQPPYADAGGYIGWKTIDLAGKAFPAGTGTAGHLGGQLGGLPELSGVWNRTGASDRFIGVSGSCSGGCSVSGTLFGGTSGVVNSTATGGNAGHNVMQPTTFVNVWIKT